MVGLLLWAIGHAPNRDMPLYAPGTLSAAKLWGPAEICAQRLHLDDT